jgi:hypothetical protein
MPPNVFWMRMCSLTPIRSPATGSAVRGRGAPPDCIRRYGRFYFSGKIAIRSPFMVLTQSLLPTSMAPVPAPITP